jgi:hypothetical protein
MKSKATWIGLALLLAAGAAGYVMVEKPYAPDANTLERLSRSFLEDLQYKDFRSSALYHHLLDQGRFDIGQTLEAIFAIKPELLDILGFDVVKVDFDSSDDRARVFVRIRYKVLNKGNEVKELDLILYWLHRHPDCPVGGRCEAGQCLNERNLPMLKPEEGRPRSTEIPKATNTVYTCDAAKPKQWFMNLDSTLNSKKYADPVAPPP